MHHGQGKRLGRTSAFFLLSSSAEATTSVRQRRDGASARAAGLPFFAEKPLGPAAALGATDGRPCGTTLTRSGWLRQDRADIGESR